MYEKVQDEQSKKKSNAMIFVIAAVCVVVLAILGFTIFVPMIKRNKYWDMVSALSAATNAGAENDSITCTYENNKYKMDSDSAYELYKILMYREDVDMKIFPVSTGDGIHVDYGNGDTLYIWPIAYKRSTGNEILGIGAFFRNADGDKYVFTTDNIYYNNFEAIVKKLK